MLRQLAACWLPCKVMIVKINLWFGFYSWWFVSQQMPSAWLLGLGSKLYPSNKQRVLNKDVTRCHLFHVLQNRASERKALLAGCTSCCSKILIISKIFTVVLKLLRPSYLFQARLLWEGNFIFWECFFFLECQINSLPLFRLRVVSPTSCSLTSEVVSLTRWVSPLTAFSWSVDERTRYKHAYRTF